MTIKQRIKIISLGDTNSGKSCIIRRFCEGRFLQTYTPTIGIDYGVKEMKMNVYNGNEKIDLCVHFWDFSGDSEYAEIVNEFFDDIDAAFIVYDITNRQHFTSVEKWIQESKIAGVDMERVSFVLCANKIDCDARKVSREEGEKLAVANHMDFFETSSCTGENVEEMMLSMFQKAIRRRME